MIRLEKLQDVEKAISRYREIIEDNPEDFDAIAALDHIFTRLERWDELIAVLRQQASVMQDEEALERIAGATGQSLRYTAVDGGVARQQWTGKAPDWLLDEPDSIFVRVGLTLASPFVIALGTSLYLGVHWGPGPRDGLMTGLNERGVSIRLARFLIELTAFVVGFVLGGAVGWGSAWAVLAIGPAVQWMLPWFDRPTDDGWQSGRDVAT